jgi:hypothetical protein
MNTYYKTLSNYESMFLKNKLHLTRFLSFRNFIIWFFLLVVILVISVCISDTNYYIKRKVNYIDERLSKIEKDTENNKKRADWEYKMKQEDEVTERICKKVGLEYVIIRNYWEHSEWCWKHDYKLEIYVNDMKFDSLKTLSLYIEWYENGKDTILPTKKTKKC